VSPLEIPVNAVCGHGNIFVKELLGKIKSY